MRVLGILGLLLLLILHVISVNGVLSPGKFNVLRYGAVPDGHTDNVRAFLNTWKRACAYGGRSRVIVPGGIYLLGSRVSFEGPCRGPMSFIIRGTLRATTEPWKFFTDSWIGFRYLDDLTVKGGGFLDGRGSAAWRYNDCKTNTHCRPLPSTLRFDFVKNSRVFNLRSINSKNSHFNLFACENMNISHVRLQAPADSPNTDGIRIGVSRNIQISQSLISTGDDCISMVSGSQRIHIHDIVCGPGHGISVGSLGRSHDREFVNGIHVRNCTFIGSENGVRIKTWAPSFYSLASHMVFEDIMMVNSRNPIVIDQNYCPSLHCNIQSNSAVQIKDVTFKGIRGTSSSKVAVNLQCSGSLPCRNVNLVDINLAYNGPGGRAMSVCSNAEMIWRKPKNASQIASHATSACHVIKNFGERKKLFLFLSFTISLPNFPLRNLFPRLTPYHSCRHAKIKLNPEPLPNGGP